ncbi:hypothetical protein CEQ90_04675 [Lewinellaceae bacterium SD302]|nr:hypothetical protein CEQ90_04675 [Lewinellaceae bacterium SD302]
MPIFSYPHLYFRFVLTIGIATLLGQIMNSQPAVCPPDEVPTMTPFCEQACVICDIDGFTGRNGRDENYFLPADFCTQVQHNGKWIGFIAGSENLEVRMSVSNCELGIGLEIAIYEAIDCDNYTVVSNCFGGFSSISPGTSGVFSNLQPLTVGQYYYLVMDGGLDDVCDWEFTVLSGTTEVQPLTDSGPFEGPLEICPNVAANYLTEIETGATEFSWTLDNTIVANGPSAQLTFAETGSFELCVTAANACDEAEPFCRNILVRETPITIIDTTFCTGDDFFFADSLLDSGGQYQFNFVTAEGCDSNFVINLTEVGTDVVTLDLAICLDDELSLNGQTYTTAGNYQQALLNQFGCDSLLTLELETVDCTADASFVSNEVSCPGLADGSVSFTVTSGEAPFVYELRRLTGEMVAGGFGTQLNEPVTEAGLAAGQYQVLLYNRFGDIANILNVIISTPTPLNAQITISNFASFNTSCFGSNDGRITLSPAGGTPPYSLLWQDGSNEFIRNGLNAADYAFTLTDANGCTFIDEATLTQPSQITATVNFSNPGCGGANSGQIAATDVAGGAGNYLFRLNGGSVTDASTFSGLANGDYVLEVIDVNNCRSEFNGTLTESVIPAVDISGEAIVVGLGEQARISFASINADTLIFSADPALNVVDSGSQFITIMPLLSSTLMISAISVDGCLAVDSIRVSVDGRREVYAPNAFSPNGDGVNDDFRLFFGPSVASVQNLRVFDRWGGLVFQQAPEAEASWDGFKFGAGAYVWSARVVYLDGFEEKKSGSVVLIR